MTVKRAVIYGKYFLERTYDRVPEFVQGRPTVRERVVTLFVGRRPDNIYSAKRAFMRRVHVAVARFGVPLFVTLTYKESCTDLERSASDFKAFMRRMSRRFGNVHYVAVREFQSRGAIHYHCFVWGVPLQYADQKCGTRTIRLGLERGSREIASLWGRGYVDVSSSDGSSRHIQYLAKYFGKGASDIRLSRKKLYLADQGIERPIDIKVTEQVDFIRENNTMKLLSEAVTDTRWCGCIISKLYERDVSCGGIYGVEVF